MKTSTVAGPRGRGAKDNNIKNKFNDNLFKIFFLSKPRFDLFFSLGSARECKAKKGKGRANEKCFAFLMGRSGRETET